MLLKRRRVFAPVDANRSSRGGHAAAAGGGMTLARDKLARAPRTSSQHAL